MDMVIWVGLVGASNGSADYRNRARPAIIPRRDNLYPPTKITQHNCRIEPNGIEYPSHPSAQLKCLANRSWGNRLEVVGKILRSD